MKNLTGERFGRWTVKNMAGKRDSHIYWNCICDCGNTRSVYVGSLLRGKSLSCGCLNKEGTIERCYSHGHANGGFGTRTYNAWRNMKARCQQPKNHKFPRYGGRGIVVCESWQSFEGFISDMGECPGPGFSIDRIDNNGNYCPENCRWGTTEQQMNNTSWNKFIEFNGVTKTLAEWGRTLGTKPITIHQRIKRGWSVEKALSEPVRHLKPRVNRTKSEEH